MSALWSASKLLRASARSWCEDASWLDQQCPPAKALIQTFADGSFQYYEDGLEALLCPVEVGGGEIIDTVGWFSGRPADWWLEHRIATHLGDRALRHAAFLEKPIRLLPSPEAWLASPEDAMCILDWTTDLRALFRDVPEIWCSTTALSKHLLRRLDEQVRHTYEIRVVP
jgi:hypothetical protein